MPLSKECKGCLEDTYLCTRCTRNPNVQDYYSTEIIEEQNGTKQRQEKSITKVKR